jgi:inhibitor of KinA
MNPYQPYSIFPLGDSALTIDFGNVVDERINKKVLRLFHHLKTVAESRILDLVPAYSSLSIYYDVSSFHHQEKTSFECMADLLEQLLSAASEFKEEEPRFFKIPVCYSGRYALDMEHFKKETQLSAEEIIDVHTSSTYRVYMLGFLPGFTYMGEVDYRIAIPRKPVPARVFAGAVGIAGRQTGIYPIESPGGWQIIGRTPIQTFNKEQQQPVLLQPGDEIKFYSITEDEFESYQAGNT